MKVIMHEKYAIAAAHSLPTFPDGHKCRRVHGHLWEVQFYVSVVTGPAGYAFDHADLDLLARKVLGPLDHRYLNDIPGLERGLAEDLLAWIVQEAQRAVASLPTAALVGVTLSEWSSGGVTLRPVAHKLSWPSVLSG